MNEKITLRSISREINKSTLTRWLSYAVIFAVLFLFGSVFPDFISLVVFCAVSLGLAVTTLASAFSKRYRNLATLMAVEFTILLVLSMTLMG